MATEKLNIHSPCLLWTNPNPNQHFWAQTITLAANNCDLFYVVYEQSINDHTIFPGSSLFRPGEATAFMNINGSSNGYVGGVNALIRRITASTQTSITFQNAYTIGQAPSTDRGDLGVPVAVYGFKL